MLTFTALSFRKRNDYVLARAKETVSRHFLIVGMQEDLKSYMEALEILMPQFFKGAYEIFKDIGSYQAFFRVFLRYLGRLKPAVYADWL